MNIFRDQDLGELGGVYLLQFGGRVWDHRGKGELQGVATVRVAAPERIVGIGHIRDPLAVPREVQFPSRKAGEELHKLRGSSVA